MFLPLVFSVYCSEMDYFTGNSRTRRRKIKVRVQQHLLSLAMEDMEQADQAVDQAVQEFGEALNGNSDEAVNLDFDVSTEDVDLYKASDPDDNDEKFFCDNPTEEPHHDPKRKLAEWAANRNVSHSALSELLGILSDLGLDLPKDPRTLLRSLKECNVKEMGQGSYYHFGLASAILSELKMTNESELTTDTLTVRVNVDGLPISRSSNMQLWPILGKIVDMPNPNVFIIGVYAGPCKPESVNDYMHDFIEDLKVVTASGISFNGKHYNVPLPDAFICDTPARAFLKCIKGHGGYSSCERCTQYGVYLDGKVVFPDIDSSLRTDTQFDQMSDEDHHHSKSPLQGLGIGMVSNFPLDYMHLVCLGIVRKLIALWFKGPLHCRVSSSTLSAISDHLKRCRRSLPRSFSRKPRSLAEYRQWKATEFRQFLLYTGPVVLFQRLSRQQYKNFLVLSSAMRILLSPSFREYYGYAHKLLRCFVTNFAKIYGTNSLVNNAHSLIHLADDAINYGPLDSISCFPFENYLGQLKKLVRRPQNPVQQIVRRVYERQLFAHMSKEMPENVKLTQPHESGPMLTEFTMHQYVQYKMYKHKDTIVSISTGANCFELEGRVVIVRNILHSTGGTHVVYELFEKGTCFFNFPIDSTALGIRLLSKLSGQLSSAPVTDFTKPLLLLSLQKKFVALPQLHST